MNSKASAIVDRIRELEAELEIQVAGERERLGERLGKGRAELNRDIVGSLLPSRSWVRVYRTAVAQQPTSGTPSSNCA